MVVKIVPNDKGNPPGKLADAELHFTDGVLDGLKLIGFAVWERRSGSGRNVTFPARQYAVNGERRSFALLRPIADAAAQERIRDLVLGAFAEYEERSAVAPIRSSRFTRTSAFSADVRPFSSRDSLKERSIRDDAAASWPHGDFNVEHASDRRW